MPFLKLAIEPDEDGICKLHAEVSAGSFSGAGSAWFDSSEIEIFAEAIGNYPLPAENPPTLRGGFWDRENSQEITQEHLYISIFPSNSRGQIGVHTRLAQESWPDSDPRAQNAVSAMFTTSYMELSAFSEQLLFLCKGKVKNAIINSVEV